MQLLPNSASDQRQQLLRRLAAGDSGIDLMSIDPVFVAEFAEAKFLAPVPQRHGAGFTKDTVKRGGARRATWKGRTRRGAVLGQHPAALVPQERRQGRRAGHDQAGDLGRS